MRQKLASPIYPDVFRFSGIDWDSLGENVLVEPKWNLGLSVSCAPHSAFFFFFF